MRIKSYFAESVQDAMERAREELGPDAMLVHSKNTEPELRQLGKYEVVFGIGKTETSAGEPVTKPGQPGDSAKAGADPVLHELSDLRKELEVIRRSIARHSASAGSRRPNPEMQDLLARLEQNGFSAEFADELLSSIEPGTRAETERSVRQIHAARESFSREAMERSIVTELERRIRVSAGLGTGEGKFRPVMLVGPAGSGKTSTLVKLALQYGLKARTSLDFYTTDVFRVGGSEQLSRYARIAGARFESFQSPAALATALQKRGGDRLVLIDTPGFCAAEMEEAAEWAQLVEPSGVEVQLVLPATLRTRVAIDTAERFKVFNCQKLILTNWDQTDSPAAACELVIKVGIPLSFIGNGQQIPEDLYAASAAELAQQAMPRLKGVAVSAA